MTDNTNPTLKSWLRDGATLVGLDDAKQAQLKAKGGELLDGAVRDLETIEGGIKTLETKATEGLQKLRKRFSGS